MNNGQNGLRVDHATVLVLAKGVPEGSLRPDTMPFMEGLGRQGIRSTLRGVSTGTPLAALSTGHYGDRAGGMSPMVYDPEGSPFRWLARRPGSILASVQRPGPVTRAVIKRFTRHDPGWVPPGFLPSLRPVDPRRFLRRPHALGVPSMADLCREHGLRLSYLGAPGSDAQVLSRLVRALRDEGKSDLYIAELSGCQQEAIARGPSSDAFHSRTLRGLDQGLASVHAALSTSHASWDLLVCGDEGMTSVDHVVDVAPLFKDAGVRPGKDYVAFVQGPLMRLWYHSRHARSAIEARLAQVRGVQLVPDEERLRSRIPMDRSEGDRLVAAQPGVVFSPEWGRPRRAPTRGMHGYLDKQAEGGAPAVLVSSSDDVAERQITERPLVDVFPTLCDLLGLRTPGGQEGRSLVKRRRGTLRPTQKEAMPREVHARRIPVDA